MIIAFGTTDKKNLNNGHIGESKYFVIYEFINNKFKKIVEVENTSEEERMHGDPNKAKSIAKILNKYGVDVICGLAMGLNVQKMRKRFVPIISREKDIKKTFKKIKLNIAKIKEELDKEEKAIIILN